MKQFGTIVLLLAAMLANGQDINNTLYVNPAGDDANDGSLSSPFRTLTTAFAHLTNSTRLVISGNHSNACVAAGLGLPVRLALTNIANVELVGVEGATLYFAGYGNGLHFCNFTNLSITGITFGADPFSLLSMNPADITTGGAIAIRGTNNNGLVIRDCRFVNWPDQGVTAWVGNWGEPHAHTTDNVWIQNNVFLNVGGTNFPGGLPVWADGTCLSSFFRNHVWVQNNYASNCCRFFESEQTHHAIEDARLRSGC